MAISEKVCWEILEMAKEESVSSTWLKGEHAKDPPLHNAIPLYEVERRLVLKYQKNQIESSLYFLEKRGYLKRHGFQGLTRVALQLSDSAIEALRKKTFSLEEEPVFQEALLELKKPGMWGIKLNLEEVLRRIRKYKAKFTEKSSR